MEGRGPGLWREVIVTGIQWETIEGVKGDSEIRIDVELEGSTQEAGHVGDGVAVGDLDELETCC